MRWILRVLLTLVLLLGLYFAQQQWRYQHAVAQKQLQRATAIWPANAEAWRDVAEQVQFTDFAASARAAQRAVQANPDDWNNWAVLAQAQMELGNMSAARQSMRAMASHATGFAAHWQYANLLLLAGDTAGFWPQAIEALSFAPYNEISPALHQMWRFAQRDPAKFNAAIAAAVRQAPDAQQPTRLETSAAQFYLDEKQPEAVAPWWHRALHDPKSDPNELLAIGGQYLAMLAALGKIATAQKVWHNGRRQRIFTALEGPSATNLIASGSGSALGWQLCTTCGPWVDDTAGTLSFSFHGNQQDTLTLARQRLLLDPAHSYHLSFRQTAESGDLNSNASGASGVQVEITGRNYILLQSGAGTFRTPAAAAPWTLTIAYQRPPGQVPFTGTVTIADLKLTPQAQAPRQSTGQ